MVVLAVIAIGVLVIGGLAWFFLGRGPAECTEAYCENTTSEIDIPPDFEPHSKLFERNPDAAPLPGGFDLKITIPLESSHDRRPRPQLLRLQQREADMGAGGERYPR